MYENKKKIILASGSPRRQEFLRDMGLSFEVVVASINEKPVQNELPEQFVIRMAEEKARYVAQRFPEDVVISGDTIVCLGDDILGKPESKEHAIEMLMALSGKSHIVRSAFCVMQHKTGFTRSECVATRVQFTAFTREVAWGYVKTGEPMDKAGGYGIQGIGTALVQSISGSYSNVVGLPVAELAAVLLQENFISPVQQARI